MSETESTRTVDSAGATGHPWRKRSVVAAMILLGAMVAWWVIGGNAGVSQLIGQAQQPAGQNTPVSSDVTGNPAGNMLDAGQPLTVTAGMPGAGGRGFGNRRPMTGTVEMPMGGAAGMPPGPPPGTPLDADESPAGVPAGSATDGEAAPPAAAAATSDLAGMGIVAVAGMDGSRIEPLDGAAWDEAIGARLTLIGRSADDAWFLARTATGSGWVAAAAIVAFNTERLPVADGAPPAEATAGAEASTTEAATAPAVVGDAAPATADDAAAVTTASDETAAVTTVAATESAADSAITAMLDTTRSRGLNVRTGPGVGYARVATLAADDVVTVTGRNRAGDWLEVASPALDGGSGWVSAYYMLIDGSVDTLPVTAPATTATAAVATAEASATPGAVPTVSTAASSAGATVTSSRAPAAGLSGTLVFESRQGGTIYAYDLDNGRLWPLSTGFDPAISPDGQTVAFTRQGDDGGLYLIAIDGSNERRIYTGPLVMASPKWSTDGSRIVFSYATAAVECRDLGSGRCVPEEDFTKRPYADLDPNDYRLIKDYTYDLGIVGVDGSNFHSLSALQSSRAPDWGAGGIVYQSQDGVQVIQDEQGARSQVVEYDMLQPAYQDPDWQPGGGRILFQKQGASHWEIWSMDANGGNIVALTQPQTTLVDALPSNVAAAWSPDGSRVVYVSNREADGEAGAWRLWVMNADGSNQQQLPIDVEINYTFGAEQMVSWGQ